MTIDEANALCEGVLPGTLGLRFTAIGPGHSEASVEIARSLLAPNGLLHAGTIVTLADTACGVGTMATPGPDRTDFATIDLSCNFIGTAPAGLVSCTATLVHGGRTTQVWDATVRRDDGRTIALFRATQLVLDTPRDR